MVSCYELFIRHFMLNYVLFINAFCAFVKTQNIHPSKKRSAVVFISNTVVSAIYSCLIVNTQSAGFQIVSYAGIALSLSILIRKDINKSLIVGLICTCYAHVLKLGAYYISSFIVYFLFGPIFGLIPYLVTCVVSVFFRHA